LKVKIGIIGTGTIAQLMHIPYIKEIEKYDLAALCDASPGLVKTIGEKYAVSHVYTDHLEMLRKENLDAVVVCAPDEYHDILCVDALEAGCHVLVEKPLALSIKAADKMISASRKAGRHLMVAYMKIYDPGYEAGASLMKEAEDVSLIRVHDFPGSFGAGSMNEVIDSMIKTGQMPIEKQEESRKRTDSLLREQLGEHTDEEEGLWRALLAFATHDMAILRGAFGNPKKVITTAVVPGFPSKTSWMKVIHSTILSILDYGKAKCSFEIGGPPRTWFDEELVAYCSNQTISIRFPYPWIKNEPTIVEQTRTKNGGFETSFATYSYEEAFKREHLHFLSCIEKNTEPRTPGTEGRKDLEVLYEIIEKCGDLLKRSE
jgi:predicted dehydrogenase